MRRAVAAAYILILVGAAHGAATAAEFSDKAVAEAIRKGRQFLWASQQADGSWQPHGNYAVGPTALAAYALLESGDDPQDPRMAKALKFLAETPVEVTVIVYAGQGVAEGQLLDLAPAALGRLPKAEA